MRNKREISRLEGKRQRALAKSREKQRVATNCVLAGNAIKLARVVVADPGVKRLMILRGIGTVPKCLAMKSSGSTDRREGELADTFDNTSLEFTVVWKFMYPLINDVETLAYLNGKWPKFVPELKDAFIALVVDGPFPHSMSGHRGRNHQKTNC